MRARHGKIESEMVSVTDTGLLIFLAVVAAIHVAGITILGVMLRESLRLTRAVGALVIQQEEDPPPLPALIVP